MGPRLHLPYAATPADEFQLPDGSWAYVLRAIVTDSWLLWQHALPADLALRRQLDAPAVAGITALAQELHQAHLRFPDYRQLVDSPFQISCWWDPSDPRDHWRAGTRLLGRIAGYRAAEVVQQLAGCPALAVQPRSLHWLEISLRPAGAQPPPRPSRSPAPPPGWPGPPGHPIPAPETPGGHP
jgi:hypothetical protein